MYFMTRARLALLVTALALCYGAYALLFVWLADQLPAYLGTLDPASATLMPAPAWMIWQRSLSAGQIERWLTKMLFIVPLMAVSGTFVGWVTVASLGLSRLRAVWLTTLCVAGYAICTNWLQLVLPGLNGYLGPRALAVDTAVMVALFALPAGLMMSIVWTARRNRAAPPHAKRCVTAHRLG